MSESDSKFSLWAEQFLPAGFRCDGDLTLTALTGDAGFRRYYRLNCQPSLLAVNAPPAKENNPAYVKVSQLLAAQGVRTPKIHAVNFAEGFLLIEDFGSQLLRPVLNAQSVEGYYRQAMNEIGKIQQMRAAETQLPRYDAAYLNLEMSLFPEWFIGRLLNVALSEAEKTLLDTIFAMLVESALAQPQRAVHRDFHCRNLMLLENGELGVIDFQDAMYGAATYDLVSLLKDCYVRWPVTLVEQLALAFRDADEAMQSVNDADFLRWFDLMGLQRHIKVLGIFARLWLRDGKAGYLKDLPLVLRYTLEVTARYPELAAFDSWLREKLVPLLPAQPWYSDYQTAGDVQ